jgi:hypothetical protein
MRSDHKAHPSNWHLSSSLASPAYRCLLGASAVYGCCILLFFYPTFGEFTTALIGPPEDNMQDLWNTWYSQMALASDPRQFLFTRILFFPEGTSLVYHSFSYGSLIGIFLLRSLFGLSLNLEVLVGLHNLMLLLPYYFGAMGAFMLTWKFTQHFLSALVSGYIFAFSPFHFAHTLHHMGVSTIQFIPFFVFYTLRYLERPLVKFYMGSVVFCVLGSLSSWYYLVYNAYFLLFYYVYTVLRQRTPFVKVALVPIVAILAGTFVLLSPLIIPMLRKGIGNRQVYPGGHDVFVADLVGFVAFHPYHLLSHATQWVNAQLTGNPWEASVYLGLVNIGLLAWAMWRWRALQHLPLAFCLGGMGVFMLLAAGHSLHVLGWSVPYVLLPTALTEWLPFLSNVRTPSRAMAYAYLFLAVAVGCILKALCGDGEAWGDRRPRQASLRWTLIIALCALLFVDFYAVARDTTPVTCPQAYEAIGGEGSHSFGILDLPATYEAGNRAMMYQICHQHPIVHASISRKPTATLIDRLEFHDLPRQQQQLLAHGVRYIVVHTELPPGERALNLSPYLQFYRTVYTDQSTMVFAVDEHREEEGPDKTGAGPLGGRRAP